MKIALYHLATSAVFFPSLFLTTGPLDSTNLTIVLAIMRNEFGDSVPYRHNYQLEFCQCKIRWKFQGLCI